MPDKLTYDNFRRFQNFPEKILREIVREGETEMQARLQTANSADQRGLNILGFQVTALVASVGGIFALLNINPIDRCVISIGTLFAFGLIVSIIYTHLSIFPKKFAFPGNRPDSWVIEDWHDPPSTEGSANLKAALSEQCYCLYSALYDNQLVMEQNAENLKTGMAMMIFTSILSALLSGYVIILRMM